MCGLGKKVVVEVAILVVVVVVVVGLCRLCVDQYVAVVGSLPELKRMSAFELMKYVSTRDVSSTPIPTPSVNIWGSQREICQETIQQHIEKALIYLPLNQSNIVSADVWLVNCQHWWCVQGRASEDVAVTVINYCCSLGTKGQIKQCKQCKKKKIRAVSRKLHIGTCSRHTATFGAVF